MTQENFTYSRCKYSGWHEVRGDQGSFEHFATDSAEFYEFLLKQMTSEELIRFVKNRPVLDRNKFKRAFFKDNKITEIEEQFSTREEAIIALNKITKRIEELSHLKNETLEARSKIVTMGNI